VGATALFGYPFAVETPKLSTEASTMQANALLAALESALYIRVVCRVMADEVHAKLFWSGGSQAVRLPKAMRIAGVEVLVRRRGETIVLEPVPEADDWGGFWDRLLPLKHPVRRHETHAVEKRKPV